MLVEYSSTTSLPGTSLILVTLTLTLNSVFSLTKFSFGLIILLAFGKTEILNKNESQVLDLTFTGYDMASYDCYD